jgi:hypothetical protein
MSLVDAIICLIHNWHRWYCKSSVSNWFKSANLKDRNIWSQYITRSNGLTWSNVSICIFYQQSLLIHFCEAVDSFKTHSLTNNDETKVIWVEIGYTKYMRPLTRYLAIWVSRSARNQTKTQGWHCGFDFGKLPTNDEVIINDSAIPAGNVMSNSSSTRTKNGYSWSILQMMLCIITSSSSDRSRIIVEVSSSQMSRKRIIGFVRHRWSLRRRSMSNRITCSGETMTYCTVHV